MNMATLTHVVGAGVVQVRVGAEGLVDPVGDHVLAVAHELAGVHLEIKVVQDSPVLAHPQLESGLEDGRVV